MENQDRNMDGYRGEDILIPEEVYDKICMYIEKEYIDFMGIS
tara:strand:+ start:412 stop:537 length:126 start_codon:yes stop_codon:yes gene_type:complete